MIAFLQPIVLSLGAAFAVLNIDVDIIPYLQLSKDLDVMIKEMLNIKDNKDSKNIKSKPIVVEEEFKEEVQEEFKED